MKRYLQVVWAVLWKDVRIESRTKDMFTSMAVFAVLALLIFNFAFELRVPDKRMVVPGVLCCWRRWTAAPCIWGRCWPISSLSLWSRPLCCPCS